MKGLLLLALSLPLLSFSQKLENQKAIVQGDKIIVTYDLSLGFPGDKFDVSLYGSHNNFSSPLQRVNGDVGRGLTPGKGKTIEVDARNEIGNYKGELSFEVRAEVIAAFTLTSAVGALKRGKSMSLAWRGGTKNQDVKIELIRGGVSQGAVGSATNNGSYQWTVPPNQKTGSDYQLHLVNGKEEFKTESFSIKHKVPTLLKVIPFIVVAAVVGLAGGSKSASGTAKDNSLPMPPDLGLVN